MLNIYQTNVHIFYKKGIKTKNIFNKYMRGELPINYLKSLTK
ncbi:hypothetical protein CLOSBL3_20271 [Clostridiaceae bacterium BL-3]|nr:hypothetical protein CLOSBL3_20271 [Clostridiaceae bacterium BL-3]